MKTEGRLRLSVEQDTHTIDEVAWWSLVDTDLDDRHK